MPRLCTHQSQPQGGDLILLPERFDLIHQPANGLDALLVGLRWLDEARCFSGHTPSVAKPSSGTATTNGCQ